MQIGWNMNPNKLIQLDFFGDDREIVIKNKMSSLELDVNKIGASSDKVRKALFARHNEIAKMVREMESRLDILESNICKGNA
jgi:hypothetical protein